MKICFISNGKYHTERWAKAFKKLGVDFVHIGPPTTLNVPKYEINDSNIIKFYFNLFRQLPKIIRKENPDYIITMYLTTYGIVTTKLLNKYKVIGIAIGSDILIDARKIHYKFFLKRVIQKFYFLIGVSPRIIEAMRILGVPDKKMALLPIGLDEDDFVLNYSIESLPKELQVFLSTTSTFLLSSRSLERIYNIETIILGLNEYVKNYEKDVRLIIMSKGSDESSLRKLVNSLNLNSYVFFTGFVSNNVRNILYTISDVFISASLSDGLPVSVLEGLAHNSLPLLSDISANRSIFTNDNQAFASFFSPKDPVDFAIKLNSILVEDFSKWKKINREFVQANYQFTNTVKKFIIHLENM